MNSNTRNFLIGFGSIFDIMPTPPRRRAPSMPIPKTPEEINAEAWNMVGESFRMALGKVHHETRVKRTKR